MRRPLLGIQKLKDKARQADRLPVPGTFKHVAQLLGPKGPQVKVTLNLTAQSADAFLHCAVHSYSSSARLEPMRARLSSFKHCLPDMGKQRYFR